MVDEAASLLVVIVITPVEVDRRLQVVGRKRGVQIVQALDRAAGAVTEGDVRGGAAAGRGDRQGQAAERGYLRCARSCRRSGRASQGRVPADDEVGGGAGAARSDGAANRRWSRYAPVMASIAAHERVAIVPVVTSISRVPAVAEPVVPPPLVKVMVLPLTTMVSAAVKSVVSRVDVGTARQHGRAGRCDRNGQAVHRRPSRRRSSVRRRTDAGRAGRPRSRR